MADLSEARNLVDSVEHWYHQIEVAPGLVTPGVHESRAALQTLELPDDLTGRRVLDIGTRDGFFAFECERRGADVTAIDYATPEATGFLIARELLGSRVEFVKENVYDLTVERYGQFDLILFLGVLYHVRDPMRALDAIWEVARGRLIVETQVIDDALLTPDGEFRRLADLHPDLQRTPLMQFYPGASLNADETSVWAPNKECLRGMLVEAGFSVTGYTQVGQRGVAFADWSEDPDRRRWRELDRSVGM